jgi:hypothetical protein
VSVALHDHAIATSLCAGFATTPSTTDVESKRSSRKALRENAIEISPRKTIANSAAFILMLFVEKIVCFFWFFFGLCV